MNICNNNYKDLVVVSGDVERSETKHTRNERTELPTGNHKIQNSSIDVRFHH